MAVKIILIVILVLILISLIGGAVCFRILFLQGSDGR